MTTSMYCEATHPKSHLGCYECSGHVGKHRGYATFASEPFYWDKASAPQPVSPTFTRAEVGILLTCLQPVTQFFPELVKKLEGMQG